MAILARVPQAVLWLLSGGAATDERLRQQAAGHGVHADRVVFAPRVADPEHLARYPLADLFLDTSPFGAHVTASDALWMGVPVLTLLGHSFASRACASLVRAADQSELVCSSRKEYEDRAVELANRPDGLRALHDSLCIGRDSFLLFDMTLLVGRLEALYQQMWNEYLGDRLPRPDLSNLAIYADIGGGFEFEPADRLDLQAYERRYTDTLAYRDSVSPVPRDCRLWDGSR
jgi:predicted O-linked N-acetylglucosamine transferase (SPINDLY family)